MPRRPLRVLHAPSNIAGNAASLARAERQVGLDSRLIVLKPHRFGYAADEVLLPDDAGPLAVARARRDLRRRACTDFDVVHFNFGRSTTGQRHPATSIPGRFKNGLAGRQELRDLPMLAKAGRPIFMTYQGDDARQGDVLAKRVDWDLVKELGADYYDRAADTWKRERIRRVDRYAAGLFGLNPDLLRVLPPRARFVPYASVHPDDWEVVPPQEAKPPLILHAPSHQGIKGTRYVLAAMDELRARGLQFRFRLVENLPHAEAMRLYAEADLLVDQVLIGWYGGLAVELMAMGKPVVAHVRLDDLRFLPKGMADAMPVIQATHHDLADVLEEWLMERRHEWRERGLAGRAYVERWHHPQRIATALARLYLDAAGRDADEVPAPDVDPLGPPASTVS